jgi:hypothetical protein
MSRALKKGPRGPIPRALLHTQWAAPGGANAKAVYFFPGIFFKTELPFTVRG